MKRLDKWSYSPVYKQITQLFRVPCKWRDHKIALDLIKAHDIMLMCQHGDTSEAGICRNTQRRGVAWNPKEGLAVLFHEIGHHALGHTNTSSLYLTDEQIYAEEIEAWDYARKHCRRLGIYVDEDYVKVCLAGYADADACVYDIIREAVKNKS